MSPVSIGPLLAALVLGTVPLAAQQTPLPRHQMMGDPVWMREVMGPMMRVMPSEEQ